MSALSSQPLSPLDGRYHSQVGELGAYLSEAGLNRARLTVEVEWLIFQAEHNFFGVEGLSASQAQALREVYQNFSDADVAKLAEIEAQTRHDVKAVEYYLREKLAEVGLEHMSELAHFAATSEDINNIAYALTIRSALTDVWLPRLDAVVSRLSELARRYRDVAMLARTHGQPATPTSVGKELAVFAYRLRRQRAQLGQVEYLAKFSGATGTYSAHIAALPDRDWPALAAEFLARLGLRQNPLTTQIEPHDWQAELYARLAHTNRIAHNLATDMWSYISLGYFRQRLEPGTTGSSTMPHKINPIRFENAEANLEISTALFDALTSSLVTSRLQRDLTDSSTQRNIGVAFGHSVLALDNLYRGLGDLELDRAALEADLEANWEVIAEAIQTVIRGEIVAGRSNITDPYGALKELTRGKRVSATGLSEFIRGLDISAPAKDRLLALTPSGYLGLAADLVDALDD